MSALPALIDDILRSFPTKRSSVAGNVRLGACVQSDMSRVGPKAPAFLVDIPTIRAKKRGFRGNMDGCGDCFV